MSGAEEASRAHAVSTSDGAVPLDALAISFEDFYAVHRDEMVRALSLALRDPALGTEAADEAFARACQRWEQVSEYTNPAGWVFRVGLNWARSWLRRLRRERERQSLVAQPEAVHDAAPDLDIERLLGTLNDSHRAVIVARFYLDWSVAETAAALGIAEGTVKSRLNRALEQFRTALGVPSGLAGPDEPVRIEEAAIRDVSVEAAPVEASPDRSSR